ncbi:unnamed protein product [Eruca vesicaria subsp. sativa]|uniref:Uncharacterized protein n=1 Tax=Eruca vesicaria subsp. sativa TaxID=29727 RepID=A0ABC8JMQ8_ERUVS|nr:unnamed protein product [Eruca vesicaria subsp. sativa]
MGGSTSKQKRNSTMRSIKGRSYEGMRRPTRRDLDEKERVISALKMAETEWRKERKKLREEVTRIRQKMQEKEDAKAQQQDWEWVVEQMCLERAVREEAVERWKQLYFTVKTQLDDLIHTTYEETLQQKQQGGAKTVQELRKKVKVREDTIETLEGRIAFLEKQRNGKEREIELLRQSLRILGSSSGKKRTSSSATRNLPIFKTKFMACK